MFQYYLGRGTILTSSPIYHNTGHGPLTAHCVDGSRTVGQYGSTVGVFDVWTEEWALVSLSNALLGHRASHRVGVARTASHTFSAVPRWMMWAVEWAGVSFSNADFRHLTSHGVDVTRACSHSCSAVRGWVGWADEWTGFSRCPIYHNTGHGPLTAHCIDGSSTVGQYGSTVRVFDMWTEERAGVTLTNADLRHRASHGVGLARTASHTFSAVHRW